MFEMRCRSIYNSTYKKGKWHYFVPEYEGMAWDEYIKLRNKVLETYKNII
jgi:hypothetical protein